VQIDSTIIDITQNVPALLHANGEARLVGLKEYRTITSVTTNQPPSMACPVYLGSRDVVVMGDGWVVEQARQLKSVSKGACQSLCTQIRHLIVVGSHFISCPFLIRPFVNLETLTFERPDPGLWNTTLSKKNAEDKLAEEESWDAKMAIENKKSLKDWENTSVVFKFLNAAEIRKFGEENKISSSMRVDQ
jgi:hypothetical protein